MTYKGTVKNGVVVLDEPSSLPEGTPVEIRPTKVSKSVMQLKETLLRWAGKADGLPSDMARNHDHYIHGRARK